MSVDLTPVTSSNVRAIGHDPETNTLHVEFKSGDRYEYPDVTREQHQALMAADSIGSHLHRHHIKGNTNFRKAA